MCDTHTYDISRLHLSLAQGLGETNQIAKSSNQKSAKHPPSRLKSALLALVGVRVRNYAFAVVKLNFMAAVASTFGCTS